ncbi:hypothetical protein [Kitasatospora camelliae]|uniref:Gram-positive cocci surface proteins LPxTG domain-containing protein n=1 Tax=Kitasatospora camelliae TaxID=3156397 RepID=A0AAU8K6Q8_9ACTN
MRKFVISASTRNVRSFSARRRLASVAAAAVLAGGVQLLATDTAWACEGPHKALNPIVSREALQRHHNGAPAADFVQAVPLTLAAGSSVEIGVEFANLTGAAFDAVVPTLTLKDAGGGQRLHLGDVTVEVMREGVWKKLGTDDGCGGEAVRVDTSPLVQGLPDGRAGRALFRVRLAAGAPGDLTALTLSTSAFGEVNGYGPAHTTTVGVAHPDARPAPGTTPTTLAAPTPTPAPDRTAAPAAPATPAPTDAGLAQTGADAPTGFLAASAGALAALGAGPVLIAVGRVRARR